MNSLHIRHATLDDLEVCHQIESACFPPSEAAPKSSIETRIRLFPEGFLVAELDGAVVGLLNSGATNQDDISDEAFKKLIGHDAGGKHLVIFSLAVLPNHQKQGIAGRLLQGCIQEAEATKRATVLLLCKSHLIPYYQRFGFIDRGTSASTHGGSEWHEMALIIPG